MSKFTQNTMEEKKYIIENQNSFELKDIFECGQCFRWNKQEDGSYIGVIKKRCNTSKKRKKDLQRNEWRKRNK